MRMKTTKLSVLKRLFVTLLLSAVVCSLLLPINAKSSQLKHDVTNGGGEGGGTALLKLRDSIGQPAVADVGFSTNFNHFTGFWYAVTESTPPCPQWLVPLDVTCCGVANYRIFGVHCMGTEGYDEGLDTLIPPPGFECYSYFQGEAPFNYLSTDIRSSDSTLIEWNMVITNNDPDSSVTVIWSLSDLPDSGSLTMADSIDMRVRNSVVFCCGNTEIPILYGIQPDFSIDAIPDSEEVAVGDTATYEVVLTSHGGFSLPCSLTVSNIPPGASSQMDPEVLVPTGSSILRVVTTGATPPGLYQLSVTARSNDLIHSRDILLMVTGPCPHWSVPLAVRGMGLNYQRTFGVHCDASDEYDPGLDTLIPPPGFDFYAYFLGVPPFNYMSADIRSSADCYHDWTLVITNNNQDSCVTFDWEPLDIPDTVSCFIDDSVDMKTRSSAVLCSGNMEISIACSLCVAPDFVVNVRPSSRTISPGDSTVYRVEVTALHGFDSLVTCSVSGLPANANSEFVPTNTVIPTDTCFLRIRTNPSIEDGTYELTVIGEGGGRMRSDLCTLTVSPEGWTMPLYATCLSSAYDSLSYLGASPSCSDSFDPDCDIPEPPPPPGDWVRLLFPHPEWGLMFDEFNCDIRAPFPCDSIKMWDFDVQTNHATQVRLSWQISQVPLDCGISLLDGGGAMLIPDLRTTPNYSFSTSDQIEIRNFKIRIGLHWCEGCTVYAAGWTLASLPCEPRDPDPDSVFGDDVPIYYLWGWDDCGYYSPDYIHGCGEGFWLGLLEDDTLCVEGTFCEPLTGPICIPLDSCWNAIGCPYCICVDWSRTKVACNGDTVDLPTAVSRGWVIDVLYGYREGGYVVDPTLCPWLGDWFPALVSGCELCVYPETVSKTPKSTIWTRLSRILGTGDDNWLLSISASLEDGTSDALSAFGVLNSASDGFDTHFDYPEPPDAPGMGTSANYIRLFFTHPEWKVTTGDYFNWDVRKPLNAGEEKIWRFEVESNAHGALVALCWEASANQIPEGYDLSLIDLDGGRVEYNMLHASSMTFIASDRGEPRHFMIIATKSSGSEAVSSSVPQSFRLWQNHPNPFNPITEIRYQVPEVCHVLLSIYNVVGQLVCTLTDATMDAGIHSVYWDGLDSEGKEVASGIYFYRLAAEDHVMTKKMVLLK